MIRRARPQDAAAIHEAHMRSIREVCSKDHTPEEISGWGHRPFHEANRLRAINEHFVWVVEIDGKVEGYAQLEVHSRDLVPSGHIYGLYLAPAAVGRGLGGQLAKLVLQTARFRGAERISLESTLTALGFYKKLGFEEKGPQISVEIGGAPVRCQPMILECGAEG